MGRGRRTAVGGVAERQEGYGSTAVRRPVQLGASSLSEIEVLDGLKEGDRVVVSGSDLFGDADEVKIN